MNIRYSLLFSVELLHEYFLNRKCSDLEIIPTEDCKEAFRKQNIQYRIVENRLMAFIKENEQHEPFINNHPHKFYRKDFGNCIFRFYLKLKDPSFLSYTNCAYQKSKKYYFSNLANNKENNFLYLTTPVEEFSIDKEYLPGNLVRDAKTGQVYEAIRKSSSKKKSDVNDLAWWMPKSLIQLTTVTDHVTGKTYAAGDLIKKPGTENVFESARKHSSTGKGQLTDAALWIDRGQGQLQYAATNDLVETTNGKFNFTLSEPVKKVEISIFGFNYNQGNPGYDLPAGDSEKRTFDKPVAEVPVSLENLKPGKYKLKLNQETRYVYFDPGLNQGNIIGVVEVFNHLSASHDYALLTAEEKIKGQNYTIFFPARSVLWKYIRKDSKAQTITDTGPNNYEFKLAGDNFISLTPIPLSEGVIKTLKLEFNTADFTMSPLPNPPINRFGKCLQDDYEYLCSEMFLNY